MKYVGYIVLRFFALLLWLVPFPLLYLLSDGLAFLLQKVIGYRSKLVVEQLQKCFPEKNEKEIANIARLSYKNLSDVILEALKSFTMRLPQIRKRYKFVNPEIINAYLEKGTSVLLCGSHYNNWEWGVQTADIDFTGQAFGVYKPLANKPIDNYFNKIRERAGMRLIKMKETFSFIENNQKTAGAYFLISDQSPGNRSMSRMHWVNFFGHETAAQTGVDTLARIYNYPVFHFEVNRIKRGYYEISYTPVCLDPAEKLEGEITQAYMKILEKAIVRSPESWMWSHRRWKYTKGEIEQKEHSEKQIQIKN